MSDALDGSPRTVVPCPDMAVTALPKPAAPTSYNRYIVLIAGIVGVLGMFQPLMSLGRGKLRISVSAYELSFGLSRTHKAFDTRLPLIVELKLPPDIRSTRHDITRSRRREGRGARVRSCRAARPHRRVCGLAQAPRPRARRCGAPVRARVDRGVLRNPLRHRLRQGRRALLKRVGLQLALGAHVLLGVGIAGAIGGLSSLLKPDR